jgi:hypothetical protein
MSNIINKLNLVRSEMQSLEKFEAALVAQIIAEAGHNKLGQSTYELHGAKVTIKTGENVRLDKAKLNTIWTEFLPINRSYAYTIRQRDFDAMMTSGSSDQRRQLAEIVTTAPAKPIIKVELM